MKTKDIKPVNAHLDIDTRKQLSKMAVDKGTNRKNLIEKILTKIAKGELDISGI